MHLHCIDDWIESVMTADSLGTQQLALVLFVTGAGPLEYAWHGMAWMCCLRVWLPINVKHTCMYVYGSNCFQLLFGVTTWYGIASSSMPSSLPPYHICTSVCATYIHTYVCTYIRIQVFDATNTTRERRQIVLDVCMYNCIKVRPRGAVHEGQTTRGRPRGADHEGQTTRGSPRGAVHEVYTCSHSKGTAYACAVVQWVSLAH